MSTHPLSKTLKDFSASLKQDKVSVEYITRHFEDRSIAFFLFLCALPAAIPLPGLGINLIIAAPLVILTWQQVMLRQHVWLPRWIASKSISKEKAQALTTLALPWVIRAENLSKPRLEFMAMDAMKLLIGLLGFIMALSVCIPLPLTNTVPSAGIALMALGVIMKDGLAVITGAIVGTAWVLLISFTFLYLGMEGLDLLKESIKSLV